MKFDEVVKSMMDGKVAICKINNCRYRIKDNELQYNSGDEWDSSLCTISWMLKFDFEIEDEYPLDFRSAVDKMIGGKTIGSEWSRFTYRFNDKGDLECWNGDGIKCDDAYFSVNEVKGTWKVIE